MSPRAARDVPCEASSAFAIALLIASCRIVERHQPKALIRLAQSSAFSDLLVDADRQESSARTHAEALAGV